MSEFLRNNCDGSGPHNGPAEVRVRSIGGGGNLILCMACWERENRYCFERARETHSPGNWPQQDWDYAEIYVTESQYP